MRYALGVLLLAATTSLSCTERELTRGRASELVQALDGFKRVAYLHLPIGAPWRCELGMWTNPEDAFGEFSRR